MKLLFLSVISTRFILSSYVQCETQCKKLVAPEYGSLRIIGGLGVGSIALYSCELGKRLIGWGTSKCLDNGEWLYDAPKCKDQCTVPNIPNGHIGRRAKGRRLFFRNYFTQLPNGTNIEDEDELFLRCSDKYEPMGEKEFEIKVECKEGIWKNLPFCQPAKCRNEPPDAQNGRPLIFSRDHGFHLLYICAPFKRIMTPGNVTCHFGQWQGTPSTCVDERCYIDKITFPGLIKGEKKVYFTNEFFIPVCEKGYHVVDPKSKLTCKLGTWEGIPPCVADDCLVHKIRNGFLTKKVLTKKYQFFRPSFTFVETFLKEKNGSKYKDGHSLFVSCNGNYTFQGKDMNNVQTNCFRGDWKPSPICLRNGTKYEEKAEIPYTLSRWKLLRRLSTKATTIAPPKEALQAPPPSERVIIPIETTERNSEKVDECVCQYRGIDDLVAFSGKLQLQFGTKVKSNSTVKFYCAEFGYHRLRGPKEIKCENCRTWGLFEYPRCVLPQRGDAILLFDQSFMFLPNDIVLVDQGLSPQIECFGYEVNVYPVWRSLVKNLPRNSSVTIQLEENDSRSTILKLHNVSSKHNGFYRCSINGYEDRIIELQVRPICKKFYDNEEYRVHYERGINVGSSVIFTCKDQKKNLDGPGVLICMSDGKWTGKPPKCVISCPLLNESVGLRIEYSDDALIVGSMAKFNCLAPGIRKGVAFIKCLSNGEWSGTVPTCTRLPECRFSETSSNLIVQPKKDVYKLGDMVDLFCEFGQVLSSQVAILMCLSDGWSEEIPFCKDV